MYSDREIESKTGNLFGDLWHRYDNDLFEESVELFGKRLAANGFDLEWLKGKVCLDAGCGGGRYSIAMERHGAAKVVGVDVSKDGLADAGARAGDSKIVSFQQASVLELPFEDGSFDFCWSAGVLHHTVDPEKGLAELTRVLKPEGKLFLLLYGTHGVRWPTIMKLRPIAKDIGYDAMDEFIKAARLPANKQRTFLDDLFVPEICFYDWDDVSTMLQRNGYKNWYRFSKAKLDHEANAEVQRAELVQLRHCFESTDKYSRQAMDIIDGAIARLDEAVANFNVGEIDQAQHDWQIFGWGHHRLIAEK